MYVLYYEVKVNRFKMIIGRNCMLLEFGGVCDVVIDGLFFEFCCVGVDYYILNYVN